MKALRGSFGRALATGLAGAMLSAVADAAPVDHLVPDESALASQGAIELPPPPDWVPAASAPLRSIEELTLELRQNCDSHPQMIHQAESFVRPDHRWLQAYVKWFIKLNKPLHLQYEDQAFDCDKFSRCFVAFADLLALKGGEHRASICVGWVSVLNDSAFGGIEAGGGHALVIADSTEGLFIIEPQTGAMVPLARYPNRDQLQKVNF